MHIERALAAAGAAFAILLGSVTAQQPPAAPAPTPAPQQPAGRGQPPGQGQGQGRGRGVATFPAQQRPPGDPALIERGKTLYSSVCSACHGVDARGGQLGGPNLLRSQLALNDQDGELIMPIVKGARAERGMPPIPMPDEDIKAVAAYIHSLQAAGRPQGAPPASEAPLPNALVGDAAAGEKYFSAKCSSCHSATGDLNGLATRVPDVRMLQAGWVAGSLGGGGRGGRGGAQKPVTVTITLPSGEKIEGRLVQIDHFLVTIAEADNTLRSVNRDDRTKVEINDPLAGHKALWSTLTDTDMHDVTAYLATLK
ncbi:MAG TPA: c-type cytochrome [Vicinamibacterales bacterium]|jgi:cytochrome c oxidase cbb3-type subunit 3